MKLAISSQALPGADLRTLVEGCRRRGLGGLELSLSVGESINLASLRAAASLLGRSEPVAIVACRVSEAATAYLPGSARLAGALGVPIVAPSQEPDSGRLSRAAGHFERAGGELLLSCAAQPAAATELARHLDAVNASSLGIALDVRPGREDLDGIADVLDAAWPRLRLIRLHGGGPEGASQTGTGIGTLMARLALRRYAHPIVLTPSRPEFRRVWAMWLGHAGRWGCGSSSPLRVLPLERAASSS
jgi:hypothetical protein